MRTKLVLTFIALAYTLLVWRLYQLTLVEGEKYRQLSYKNYYRVVETPPIRGIIYDRNGTPVAYNQLRFNIGIDPHLKGEEFNQTINTILKVIPDLNRTQMVKEYKKWNSPYYHRPIVVVKYLTREQLYQIEPILTLNPHIHIETGYLRKYPFGEPLSNILGYVAEPNKKELQKNPVIALTHQVGKRGIEKYYDDLLQGKPGEKKEIVDARNKVLMSVLIEEPVSTPLKLTIDHRLQSFIYNLMKEKKYTGAVVVMKTNGEILALVTHPSYDNNLFVKGISYKNWVKLLHNLYHPLWNRPVMGLYPPGSTVKPSEVLIGLSLGAISPTQKIYCPYSIEVGHRRFRDWKLGGHGWTDAVKAIKESVDVYFYKLGLSLGIDKISREMKRLGWGVKTGIDIPGEQAGLMPTREWKEKRYHKPWLPGDTLNAVIGQGFVLATPLQVARNTALLASGKLPTPHLAMEIGDQKVEKPAKDVLTPREKKFLYYIRKGMYEVCQARHGTATSHITTPLALGCKTGTAQVTSIPQEVLNRQKEEELAYFHRSHAWITTYGPWKHPQVVVTVLVEHGGHGGSAGGPIVSQIYNWLLKHNYLKTNPDDFVKRPR
ncbi:MAG: penicillin-binding protein 2, partial [Epsilonproteobacteria bacterium]|nr:penicillin-binding protein 2 [Campylobacterota bacterium]NPA88999.1 penicillin-binding protein 2 [Campylobacterota bacterium]